VTQRLEPAPSAAVAAPLFLGGHWRTTETAIDVRSPYGGEYGLQAAIFTGSLQVALDSARALRFGGVIVNDARTFRSDQMPYGGIGESGNTREGPRYAIEQMTEPRLVVVTT